MGYRMGFGYAELRFGFEPPDPEASAGARRLYGDVTSYDYLRIDPADESLVGREVRVSLTGGTGPAPRDVTPEATLAVADKTMPGFGEQMRQISLAFVPTAILSRQVAVIRGRALIVNLPGQPKAIAETLQGLPDATPPVPGIFAAVPYCIDLIGGPYLETDTAVCQAFRPKSALRNPPAT
jgi:molybdopterin biosynthesis enzyme MoaB